MTTFYAPKIQFCIYVDPMIDPTGKVFIEAHDLFPTEEGALRAVTFFFSDDMGDFLETTELLIADGMWTHAVRVSQTVVFASSATVN